MTPISHKQVQRFQTKLTQIAAQSSRVDDKYLRELAAKRDAYLANLR